MKKEMVIKLSNKCELRLDDATMGTFWYSIPNRLLNRISLDTIQSMRNPLRSEILDGCMKLLEPKMSMADWWERELRTHGDHGQVNNDAEWWNDTCRDLEEMKKDICKYHDECRGVCSPDECRWFSSNDKREHGNLPEDCVHYKG